MQRRDELSRKASRSESHMSPRSEPSGNLRLVVLEPRPVEPWNISCEGRGAVCGYLESILVGVRGRVVERVVALVRDDARDDRALVEELAVVHVLPVARGEEHGTL
eukprot:scaffold32339_cov61-Phaeocystis_antarctica.AAC.6